MDAISKPNGRHVSPALAAKRGLSKCECEPVRHKSEKWNEHCSSFSGRGMHTLRGSQPAAVFKLLLELLLILARLVRIDRCGIRMFTDDPGAFPRFS